MTEPGKKQLTHSAPAGTLAKKKDCDATLCMRQYRNDFPCRFQHFFGFFLLYAEMARASRVSLVRVNVKGPW